MGKGREKAQQRRITEQQLALARESQAIAKQIFGQISPFAGALMAMGQQGLQGQAPDFFRNLLRPQIAQGFSTARENLTSFLGQSGQGISGLAAGPFANLQAGEAQAMNDAELQAILQTIGLGGRGAGLLSGQQNFFDPGRFLGGASQSNAQLLGMPSMGGSLLGGLVGAIPFGNVLSRIPGFGKG